MAAAHATPRERPRLPVSRSPGLGPQRTSPPIPSGERGGVSPSILPGERGGVSPPMAPQVGHAGLSASKSGSDVLGSDDGIGERRPLVAQRRAWTAKFTNVSDRATTSARTVRARSRRLIPETQHRAKPGLAGLHSDILGFIRLHSRGGPQNPKPRSVKHLSKTREENRPVNTSK